MPSGNRTNHPEKKYFTPEDVKLNSVYKNMKRRCYSKSCPHYRYYGARGIKICDEWLQDCLSFIKWAKENGYKEGTQLHRKNKKKDYCPKNCCWLEINKHNKLHSEERKRYAKINDSLIRRRYTGSRRKYQETSWKKPLTKIILLVKYLYSKVKKLIIDKIRPKNKQRYFKRNPKSTGLLFLKNLDHPDYKKLLKRVEKDNIKIIDNKILFESRAALGDYLGIPKSTIIYVLKERNGYMTNGLFKIIKEDELEKESKGLVA